MVMVSMKIAIYICQYSVNMSASIIQRAERMPHNRINIHTYEQTKEYHQRIKQIE